MAGTTPLERVKNALATGTYNIDNQKMLDLEFGGQNGWSPRLGYIDPSDGKNYSEWISSAKYVSKNVIAVVLQTPRFFDYMPDPQKWSKTLKSLLELHSKSIDGLQAGLSVEYAESPVGGAGEMQEDLTNVTRARSTVTHTFEEKVGKPINRFLTNWIRYGLMDPDTKHALIGTLSSFDSKELFTPDFYTASVLYFEPDITGRTIVEAWLCTNMAPKSNGEVVGKRDLTTGGETKEMSIEFTSITMYNQAVRQLAQNILTGMTTIKTDPHNLPLFVSTDPVSARDANLQEDVAPIGYNNSLSAGQNAAALSTENV
jgi:hypothetical protein